MTWLVRSSEAFCACAIPFLINTVPFNILWPVYSELLASYYIFLFVIMILRGYTDSALKYYFSNFYTLYLHTLPFLVHIGTPTRQTTYIAIEDCIL